MTNHDNAQPLSPSTRQLSWKPTGFLSFPDPARVDFERQASPSIWQLDIPGSHDKHVPYSQSQRVFAGSAAGLSLQCNPTLLPLDANPASQAAATPPSMDGSDDAFPADLLSCTSSIDWLDGLIADPAEPTGFELSLPVIQGQLEAQATSTSGAARVTSQDNCVVGSTERQEEASRAATGAQLCSAAAHSEPLPGSLFNPELSVPRHDDLDGSLEDLLNDLAPELDAVRADGILELGPTSAEDGTPAASDTWQGQMPRWHGDLGFMTMLHSSMMTLLDLFKPLSTQVKCKSNARRHCIRAEHACLNKYTGPHHWTFLHTHAAEASIRSCP